MSSDASQMTICFLVFTFHWHRGTGIVHNEGSGDYKGHVPGWWMGKSRTLRRCEELHLVFEATRFYATQCGVSLHNTMPLQEVWKKWHNREAELFYELARKYKTEAVATSALLMHWQEFAL